MDYKELKELLYQHECEYPKTHLTAYITFASFGPNNQKEYPWKSRTYLISSDNKAFQPNKHGYSIFGDCLDGTDPGVRLEKYMAEEQGGKDGWVVEYCCIVGYMVIESGEFDIQTPKLFYSHSDAAEYMLSQLAENGELDLEKLKKDYAAAKELCEEDWYSADQDSAWLVSSNEDWRWKIQPVCVYGPLNMVFIEKEGEDCQDE